MGHYHLHPLHSWQDILLTFAEMELDSTTMFPPGTSVMFIRSTGEPVLAQVVGHSEHGDAYRRITYYRDGKTVLHDRASVRRLSVPRAPSPPRPAQSEASSSTRAEQRALVHRRPKRSLQSTLHAFLKPQDPPQEEDEDVQFLCLQMCVYGGGVVPQGGVGDRHLVTMPQGVVGDRLPWGGERQGGGGIKDKLHMHTFTKTKAPHYRYWHPELSCSTFTSFSFQALSILSARARLLLATCLSDQTSLCFCDQAFCCWLER